MKDKKYAATRQMAIELRKLCDQPGVRENALKVAEALGIDLNSLDGTRSPEIRRTKPDRRYNNRRRATEGRRQSRPRSSAETERVPSKHQVAGSNPAGGTKHAVVCQPWWESERGWGGRPDGASLHLTTEDCKAYVKDYWDTMPPDPPDEYERPDGSPTVIDVGDELYLRIKNSKNGIRLWEMQYQELKK